jgi:inorganic pyrophosphatase
MIERFMNFVDKLNAGINPPEDINVVIEISKGSNIKHELNLENGILYIDRILSVEMVYPFNYGFIPQTIENLNNNSKNMDNLDVFVIGIDSLQPLSIINCTPIGIIFTQDQDGLDSKIIASPISKIVDWNPMGDSDDFNLHLLNKLKHFVEHHKDLEKDKFVKILEVGNKEKSKLKIIEAMENHKKYKNSHRNK